MITGITPNVSSDTNYTVTAQVSDGITNVTQTFNLLVKDTSVILPPDTTPPVITVVSPSNNQLFNVSNILLSITTNENTGIAWYVLNSGSNASMNQTSTTSYLNNLILSDGNYSIVFYAKDLAGNIGQSSSVNFSINTTVILPPDTTPPVMNIIYPKNLATYTSQVTSINYTASDANLDRCWYSLDGGVTNVTVTCNTFITGISSVNGINTWTVYASDLAGNQANQNVTFNVSLPVIPNNPPVITSTPLTQVNERTNYAYQVTTIDIDGDVLTYSLIQFPEWLSINTNTGLIIGTAPEVSADTDFNINVRVSDSKNTTTQSYVLTVVNIPVANNPPVITSTPITRVNEDTLYNYQVIATDEDRDTLIYSLTQTPNWLSINSSTGLISGVSLRVNVDTEFKVTVKVSDTKGGIATQNYVLVVKETPNLESKTKNSRTNLFFTDKFYEQKYFEQFNAPKTVIYNIPSTNVLSVSSSKNKLETTEKILAESIIPTLIMLNLILTISIILTIKFTRKNITGGNIKGVFLPKK